ncbi:MAG: hypothetical protein CMN58_06130 [Solibacterales bacterium]|uniref:2-keto-3-deoxy-L-rhamnonate aldolase n=1 Tax=Candidatus Moanibacter tarae TaxID=2200854 RepID=A0A2Z4AGS9_9BACT|nr:MAG: 2-keto-3-deoxy-L-rhamnonate aldolase [Candidatus Moanabacter tarae]MBG99905.1 hypothetical protein [Bryobacterales bacterium]|tara:strand:- start:5712 stop:6506 length:795 start_codon:yes stop_codon:yes gene_type:complete
MSIEQPIIANQVKKDLKNGNTILGFNVFESLRPSVLKIISQAGYNTILVETEHVMHNEETFTNFLVMARDNGLCPIVTTIVPSRPFVSRVLDSGALGICLSHAETPEQLGELVQWMKYPPVGERGLAMGANADYQHEDAERYCREANEATLLILKIESGLGVQNAEIMLSNDWVDAVVFGPGDLAADLGFHGEWEHPEVIRSMERVTKIALANGVAVEPAIYPKTSEEYKRLRDRGIQLFGRFRLSEYDLLREGAMMDIEIYRD